MAETGGGHLWTITVVGGEGDEGTVTINEHAHLHQLLDKGVKELYGNSAQPGDYDILIAGVAQTDLNKTLADAGLEDGATVSILSKDVSRGMSDG